MRSALSACYSSATDSVRISKNPHNLFFEELMSRTEVCQDFLQNYLPDEIVRELDFSTLEISKDTFVDEELKAHYTDMLYQISMFDEQPLSIYLLFEHKSYLYRPIVLQLLRYMLKIWEDQIKQDQELRKQRKKSRRETTKYRPVIPIVVYHGQKRWNIPISFSDFFEMSEELSRFVPDYDYLLFDLSDMSDEQIKGDIRLRVGFLLFKYIQDEALRHELPRILNLIAQLTQKETALQYLETVLRYLSRGTDKITQEELKQIVEKAFPKGEAIMATIADVWYQEGERKGKREGLQKGIGLGLELKFGEGGLQLWPEVQQIQSLDILQSIHNSLRTAKELSEVRGVYQHVLMNPS
ncbi:MAG: Rpn family recombination-promoting nuclease/putative transposase [Ardenticatenaceae bacterium]